MWTQQDSLDAPLDPNNANRYAYAGSDPVNNFDPTGRAWQGGANFCFVACFSIGATWSDDTDVKIGMLDLVLAPEHQLKVIWGTPEQNHQTKSRLGHLVHAVEL